MKFKTLVLAAMLTVPTASAYAANPVQCTSGSKTGVWVITHVGTYCQTK